MGIFDSFILKILKVVSAEIKCPYCQKVIDEIEFQTKEFKCLLSHWREGEWFDGIDMEKGVVKGVLGECNNCESFFYCDIIIKNHKVEGAINIRRCPEWMNNEI